MPASSSFGKSGFGQPAFGQPAFGQPAFGQPAFGQPAFEQTSFGSKPASTLGAPASGGFGAFAVTGTSGFTSTPTPSSPSPNVAPFPSPAQSGFGAPASSHDCPTTIVIWFIVTGLRRGLLCWKQKRTAWMVQKIVKTSHRMMMAFCRRALASEDDDDAYSRSPSPTTVPLPPSRSPSSTPNADALKPHPSSSTQSDGDESDSSEESRLSTIREESETPPGSPEKKPTPPSAPLAAPVPITPSLGIGLGRPSTRPAKSSPLAAAPMSRDEAEKLTPKTWPASPKLPFGVLPPQPRHRIQRPSLHAQRHLHLHLQPYPLPQPQLQHCGKPQIPFRRSAASYLPRTQPNTIYSKPIAKTPEPSAISTPIKGTPSMPFISVPPPPTVVPSRAELSTMEEGMQKECALLFAAMARGLEDFKILAQTASEQSKWSLRLQTKAQWEKRIRDLENNLLKGGHDERRLGARSLGPEHLETQTHLRRTVRAVQDRVQKLESHLHEHKKRLSRADSGKPGLRGRDKRLPDPVGRQRPLNVMPDVAIPTAAALNAERSAHKLKRALLGIRKQPLLNTQAASATPPPLSFQTPQRGFPIQFGLDPVTPMMGFDFPEPWPFACDTIAAYVRCHSRVEAHHRLVIIEGLHTYLSIDPWVEAPDVLDERWFLRVDEAEACRGLVKRHVETGVCRDATEAKQRAEGNDLPKLDGRFIVKNMLKPTKYIDSIQDSVMARELESQ
ncbi:hypothetical protein MIND_00892000 [Mycena indigotica]|uniref:Uncharacterized protein n=1 Tax=Mycena indigotica TaxID=2126181 RepID=A0A8H6SIF2_9AGAR|nr:uncharacterized protein MIND_00892000 [Mycena indigotica]KAF7299422.1 hypothetical protein MIND_00892000 [Mycena indigotica]